MDHLLAGSRTTTKLMPAFSLRLTLVCVGAIYEAYDSDGEDARLVTYPSSLLPVCSSSTYRMAMAAPLCTGLVRQAIWKW